MGRYGGEAVPVPEGMVTSFFVCFDLGTVPVFFLFGLVGAMDLGRYGGEARPVPEGMVTSFFVCLSRHWDSSVGVIA